MTDWPWPAPVDDSAACHLVPGLPLPGVTLPATVGPAVCLAELGRLSVVVIYPWAGRPGHPNPPGWDTIPGAHGSTPQLTGFRDSFSTFRFLGIDIYAASGQPAVDQAELANRLALPFPLLSDAEGALRRSLHLPTFETGGIAYLARLTLIIESGRLLRCFYPVYPPDRHAADVLNWLNARRSA